jgi:DNA polymerase-4
MDGAWQGRAIGLMDLDAFFASVEQLDHPEWRGKPVIVGGSSGKRGVVSTASYEARRFGVHSAMPSAQAERLCPQAIWVRGNFARYREMSDAVMRILSDETPYVERVSIDEAFFDVTPGRFSKESPVDICRRIQRRVADLGVTCSIGLSTSKTIAKIASERDKPRGLTVVPPGCERAFLDPLPVRAISGVGASTEKKLKEKGLATVGDVARADPVYLERLLGSFGASLSARARNAAAEGVRPFAEKREPKSVSSERTFAEDLLDEDEVRAALDLVAALTGSRLRRKGLKGREVTVKAKFGYDTTRTAQAQLPVATDDEHVFGPAAQKLLSTIWRPGTGVRLLGVGVSRFGADDAPEQLALFGGESEADELPDEHLRALSVAADDIKSRFGDGVISYGRDLRFKDTMGDTTPKHKDLY